MSEPVFPVFLRLSGRAVLVVGGGAVAASKVASLLEAGALVTIVAPRISDTVSQRAGVTLVRRSFEPRDLDGAWFAVAAATPEVNAAVASAAEPRHVFVNAVDDLASGSAWLSGVVRKAGVTLAISTASRAPALAGLLREALEALLPDDLAAWLALAEQSKAEQRARGIPITQRRPLLLRALNALYERSAA